MTDNEIIKALEYCPQTRACTHAECPLFGYEETVAECAAELNEKVRDLIQRQQERIDRIVEQLERLPNVNSDYWNFADLIDREDAIDIVKGVQNE